MLNATLLKTSEGTGDLLLYAAAVVGCSVVAGVFSFLTRQTLIVASRHIEFDLRNDFLSHIQRLSLSFFQNTPTGDLMAHATNDIGAVRNVVGPGIMYPADTLMTFIMVISVMITMDWQLTLFALVPLPFVSFAVYRLGKIVHQKFEERQATYSELTTRAQENLSGIRVVKAYVREEYEIGLFRALSLGLSEEEPRARDGAVHHVAADVPAGRVLADPHDVLRRCAGDQSMRSPRVPGRPSSCIWSCSSGR